MPTLNWIGKDAVVNHHREVPYRLLRDVPELGCGDPGSGNLLVEGDNLHGLKALLPYYAGQVKCIYIDPPYNTGNEGWVYNDAVNSPLIQKWLGETVGKEAEDLSRHDKWLCMMLPRLQLLKQFLRDDGVLFASIGREEISNFRYLLDEVFGANNLIEILIWNTHGHTENQEEITGVHEYILLYGRDKTKAAIRKIVDPAVPADSKIRRNFAENSITKNGPKNPPSVVLLPTGFPCEVNELDLEAFDRFDEFQSLAESAKFISRELTRSFDAVYPIRGDQMLVAYGKLVKPCRVFTGWSSADKLKAFISNNCEPIEDDNGTLRFFLSKNGVIYYRREGRVSHYVQSVLTNLGTTEKNKYLLEQMGVKFDYPKPVELISYLISLYTNEREIVLDSFAGSGTTGHAALALGENRRFILLQQPYERAEQERSGFKITSDLTAKRVSRVVEGYIDPEGSVVPGLGGGFRYCRLDAPLFSAAGIINPDVRFAQLARHVYFTETGEPLPRERVPNTPLVGAHHGTGVYLLFNGILGDHSASGGNVLTRAILAQLPPHTGPKVIYAYGCLLGEDRLRAEQITFRQTPYEITTS
jgi:DNA modification methylase